MFFASKNMLVSYSCFSIIAQPRRKYNGTVTSRSENERGESAHFPIHPHDWAYVHFCQQCSVIKLSQRAERK